MNETRLPTILVVEDAAEYQQLITASLRRVGDYNITVAADGVTGLQQARDLDPDVIILDLGLPGLDGVEVCGQLREFTDTWVIMLTARSTEIDQLIGLSVGADDYIAKPFSGRELGARVLSMLQRPRHVSQAAVTEDLIRIGDLTIDLSERQARIEGALVILSSIEFELLATLAYRPKIQFTSEQLSTNVLHTDVDEPDLVESYVNMLRAKIDSGGTSYISHIPRVGYQINEFANQMARR